MKGNFCLKSTSREISGIARALWTQNFDSSIIEGGDSRRAKHSIAAPRWLFAKNQNIWPSHLPVIRPFYGVIFSIFPNKTSVAQPGRRLRSPYDPGSIRCFAQNFLEANSLPQNTDMHNTTHTGTRTHRHIHTHTHTHTHHPHAAHANTHTARDTHAHHVQSRTLTQCEAHNTRNTQSTQCCALLVVCYVRSETRLACLCSHGVLCFCVGGAARVVLCALQLCVRASCASAVCSVRAAYLWLFVVRCAACAVLVHALRVVTQHTCRQRSALAQRTQRSTQPAQQTHSALCPTYHWWRPTRTKVRLARLSNTRGRGDGRVQERDGFRCRCSTTRLPPNTTIECSRVGFGPICRERQR
jgi:hypothetical protein